VGRARYRAHGRGTAFEQLITIGHDTEEPFRRRVDDVSKDEIGIVLQPDLAVVNLG